MDLHDYPIMGDDPGPLHLKSSKEQLVEHLMELHEYSDSMYTTNSPTNIYM